jgi:hypothetical protein
MTTTGQQGLYSLTVTTAKKPVTKLRKALRDLELGVALGVAAFILATLLGYQLISVISGQALAEQSAPVIFLARLVVEQLGPLLVVPLLAYAAAWLIEGSRTVLVTTMVLTVQATVAAVRIVSLGSDVYLEFQELTLVLLGTGGGIALGIFAMGRARRRIATHEAPHEEPALAAIDFNSVKQAQAAQAEPPKPAEVPKPAEPTTSDDAAKPAEAAPAPEQGKPPQG